MQGACLGTISAKCVSLWGESANGLIPIDLAETRKGMCLMFTLYTKAGIGESVVTHELSAAECMPSSIWPIVRDSVHAAGGRSSTHDNDLRSLCSGQKKSVRIPISSPNGHTMQISMHPTLHCSSNTKV
jgi:hypothetical protein